MGSPSLLLPVVDLVLAASRRRLGSIGLVLFVGFAVHRAGLLLLLGPGVVHDAGERLLVPVGCMLDQFLLGELKALGLASACLLDGHTLVASTFGALKLRIGRPPIGHRQTVLRWRATTIARTPLVGRAGPTRASLGRSSLSGQALAGARHAPAPELAEGGDHRVELAVDLRRPRLLGVIVERLQAIAGDDRHDG